MYTALGIGFTILIIALFLQSKDSGDEDDKIVRSKTNKPSIKSKGKIQNKEEILENSTQKTEEEIKKENMEDINKILGTYDNTAPESVDNSYKLEDITQDRALNKEDLEWREERNEKY